MQNPEICRSQAIKGALLAGTDQDGPYRSMLFSIARLWITIAETSEQLEALGIAENAAGSSAAR